MGPRLLFIGDSISEGMAPSIYRILDDGHHGTGEALIEARSGWSTRRWLREGDLPGICSSFRPTVCVVLLGTNDTGEEMNAHGYAQAVRRLRDQAAASGAVVYWITAFSGTGTRERYPTVASVVGERNTIDGARLMDGVSMSGDIHPDAAGYRLLAARVVDALWDRMGAPQASRRVSPVVPVVVGVTAGLLAAWALGR